MAFLGSGISRADAPVAGTADSGDTIEEVTVTARKRLENLQNVPESVTAFGAQAIEDARIENIADAISFTPGVSIVQDQQPGTAIISVRGVSQNRDGEPPVAFVVDGVPLANAYEFTQSLFDIERIEILKGPQGSLYGRNSIGGAVNITTREPGNEFAGTLSLRAADGDEYRIGASVSGPIAPDRAYFRLSGIYRSTDGLIENVTLRQAIDGQDEKSVRGKLLLTPSQALRIDMSAFYSRLSGGAGYWAPLTYSPFGWNASEPLGVPQGDIGGHTDREHQSGSLKIDYDLGRVTLTSITGAVDLEESLYEDFDMIELSVLEGGIQERFESYTQEFRLTSDNQQALRWVIGAFYQDTKKDKQTDVFIDSNAPAPFGAGDGNPAHKNLVNIQSAASIRKYEAHALFGQADYDFTDAFTGTLGLRYDSERRVQEIPTGAPSLDFSSLQPKVSLAYKFSPQVLTYVTVARGYRPGGFNDTAMFTAEYVKESLWSYELGAKTTLFGGRMTLNAAIYHQDFEGQQFSIVDGGGLGSIINGGKTKIDGAELELHALPVPRLELTLGAGYNNTDIRSFPAFANAPFDTAAFKGNSVPQVPDYNLVSAIQYTQPISSDLHLQARFDYRRQGRSYPHADNVSSLEPYGVGNARLSLKHDRWQVSLFGENVFDADYSVSRFDLQWTGIISGIDIGWVSPPRTYGIEAHLEF